MNLTFAYRGRSDVVPTGAGQTLTLAPNLTRDPVAFDAPLLRPVAFREAISALHDAVVSDLRFKKRDKTAYRQWKADEGQRTAALRRAAAADATAAALADRDRAVRDGSFATLQQEYAAARLTYWDARRQYATYLRKHDPQLWRQLLPCDPVITVADDALLFECFSADESTYGCLTVDRSAFGPSTIPVQLGTTNVDYSWDLYRHFQTMRTYRPTRFQIDPAGFTAATAEADHREEKIDLPTSWLRGFLQLQSAMTMPGLVVPVGRDAVYSVLAFLQRNKAKRSPRAMRFELTPGQPPVVVLEPWERRITSHATRYDGPPTPPVRVWGIKRLSVLARTLPLADRFDVHLLGTGLPSFWVARMERMQLTIGLSGWTVNDWTRSSALDLLAPPAAVSPDTVTNVASAVRERGRITVDQLRERLGIAPAEAAAALRKLAAVGQVTHDLPSQVFRWRQILPRAAGEAELGPDHPELIGARQIMDKSRVQLTDRADAPGHPGGYALAGTVDRVETEVTVDGDGRIRKGKCPCIYFRRFGLKNGPCRHMMALRWSASVAALDACSADRWYGRLPSSV